MTGGSIMLLGMSYADHNISTCNDRCHRFSDRDLLMRFHWGQGIGHSHAHQISVCPSSSVVQASNIQETQNDIEDEPLFVNDNNLEEYDQDSPEFVVEDHEWEGWEDVESEDEI